MPAHKAGTARVSSTVTKRNPRPRKYASASERQAAYRARAPEVCFRAEAKTVETLDRIAAKNDRSRAELLLSMTKFALANHDWARFGLTHRPLPYGYGLAEQEFIGPRLSNPNAYSDPALWEHSKQMAVERLGGHSARAMQLAGKIYRAAGGKYLGKRTKAQKSLEQWTAQDWTTKSGKPSRETGERYLPRKVIEGLTPAEYGATTRAKRKGTAAGQQFVKQPKRIAAKVARLKGNPTVGKIYSLRISPTIANEYLVRNIGDVIPALGDYEIKPGGRIMVDRTTLDEIIADCEFMADPKAMDASAAERRAYRAMRAVCEQALLKAEPRKENPAMKKPTPAQLAARARFAEMARSGAFKRKAKKAKTNPAKKTVSQKISQLTREGYPQKQAIAIALSEQRAGKVKRNPRASNPAKFTASQLASLRDHYSMIETIDPSSDSYIKLTAKLDAMSLPVLKQLADARIKWISALARNRVTRMERKTNPATGRKGSGTKLNPSGKKVYQVYRTMTRNYARGLPRTRVLAQFNNKADAVQYAQAYADAYGVQLRIKTEVI